MTEIFGAGQRSTRLSPALFVLYLLSMPIYCLVRLSDQQAWIGPSTALTAASLFAFSLTHCIEARGAWRSAFMLVASFAVALTMEYLGSTYGWIFGHYDYTDRLGPKLLGKVPAIIPVAWFMMLYPSWVTADLLVAQYALRRDAPPPAALRLLLRIVIAALAMTAWDLSLDPRMVADGNWVWQEDGAYFGIPLSNYLGWFVTSALIYCLWQPIVRDAFTLPQQPPVLRSQLLPVLAYVVTWLGESMANAIFWGGPGVAAAVFIGMGLFGGPALLAMLRSRRLTQAQAQPVCNS
jgi:putative membrane protein